MTTPQLENGYVKIANEIMDALSKYRIPGEQMQCLLFLLRKTYGYNKLCDRISNSQYVVATGINKRNVKRALDGLIEKRIVVKKDNEYIPTYQFNKDYRLWRLLSKKTPVVKIDTVVVKKDNNLLSKKTPTKDNKDNIQKKVIKKFISPSLAEVIKYFFERGYSVESAKKAHEYYSAGDWHDRNGNKVRNWKQKMIAVWFKDENKIKEPETPKIITRENIGALYDN